MSVDMNVNPKSVDYNCLCSHWTFDNDLIKTACEFFRSFDPVITEPLSDSNFYLICLLCHSSHSFDNYNKHYRESYSICQSSRHSHCLLMHRTNDKIVELFCFICRDVQYSSLFDNTIGKLRNYNKESSANFESNESKNNMCIRTSKRHKGRIRGFLNLGSTCFMSAVLQIIVNNSTVRSRARNLDSSLCVKRRVVSSAMEAIDLSSHSDNTTISSSSNSADNVESTEITEGCIACELNNLLHQAGDSSSSAVIPSNLLFSVWSYAEYMAGYEQQDSHEFYITLLDGLSTHIRDFHSMNSNGYNNFDIGKLFQGTMRSQLSCVHCKWLSKRDEQFLDISLSIDFTKSKSPRHKSTSQELRLDECLRHYTSLESLCEEVFCDNCHCSRKCQKQLFIVDHPQILVLHLKRFDAVKNRKNSTKVSFPLHDLDLSPFMSLLSDESSSQSSIYDLCGVVNHKGGLNQGHYVAFVRVDNDGAKNWFRCDDDSVILVSEDDVESSEGYLLFYMRRNDTII